MRPFAGRGKGWRRNEHAFQPGFHSLEVCHAARRCAVQTGLAGLGFRPCRAARARARTWGTVHGATQQFTISGFQACDAGATRIEILKL
eukprot:409873-Prymnesium_polylepis.1